MRCMHVQGNGFTGGIYWIESGAMDRNSDVGFGRLPTFCILLEDTKSSGGVGLSSG